MAPRPHQEAAVRMENRTPPVMSPILFSSLKAIETDSPIDLKGCYHDRRQIRHRPVEHRARARHSIVIAVPFTVVQVKLRTL
jgi:hypothetical protein